MAAQRISKPEPGRSIEVQAAMHDGVVLDMSPVGLDPSRQGNDLLLSFPDGSVILLTGYFAADTLSNIAFSTGERSDLPEALAALHTTTDATQNEGKEAETPLVPSAGPQKGGTPAPNKPPAEQQADTSDQVSNQGHQAPQGMFHVWDDLVLLDGRPHLGPLDVGWQRPAYEDDLYNGAGRRDDGVSTPSPEVPPLAPVNTPPVLDLGASGGLIAVSTHNLGNDTVFQVVDPDPDGGLNGQTFSLVDANGNVGTRNADGSVSLTTAYGTLTVRPDGSCEYRLDPSGAGVGGMNPDDRASDVFQLTVTDRHGASDTKTVTVAIHNGNDAPVITSPPDLDLKEAGLLEGGNRPEGGRPVAGGTAGGNDGDGDTLTWKFDTLPAGCTSVESGDVQTVTTPWGVLTLNKQTGEYNFALDQTKTNALSTGDLKELTLGLTLSDPFGGSDSENLVIRIEGSNDAPVLSFASSDLVRGDHTGARGLDDGGVLSASGRLNVQDADSDGATGGTTGNVAQQFGVTDATGHTGTPTSDGGVDITTDYGTLHINKDGSYTYTLNAGSDKVLALGSSQAHTEKFVVQVVDAHGAVSGTQTVTVEITGKNDPPKLTGAAGTHSVREAGAEPGAEFAPGADFAGTPSVNGTLSAEHTDGDRSDAIVFSLGETVVIGGVSYTLSVVGGTVITTDYGTLTLNPRMLPNGKYGCDYEFTLNNGATLVNALPNGEQLNIKFTVKAQDGSGTQMQDLTVTLTGSNDRPVISSMSVPTAVAEDGTDSTSGRIVAADADRGDSLTYSAVQDDNSVQILEGRYGRLEIMPNTGEYKYYLNNGKAQSLAQGETGEDVFTVRVKDHLGAYTESELKIPIIGKDDAPTLGNLSAEVVEDAGGHEPVPSPANPSVSGTVTASDIDDLDVEKAFELLASNQGTGSVVDNGNGSWSVEGKYGTLTFKADGSYEYVLRDNALTGIQGLNEGQSLSESFSIKVTTGHSGVANVGDNSSSTVGDLLVTVKGSNDAPLIEAAPNLSINDGNALQASVKGQLQISDADADESVTVNSAGQVTSGKHTFYVHDANGNECQSLLGQFGRLVINRQTGEYEYILDQYAPGLTAGGIESFTLVVEDGHGGTAEKVITVNVGALTNPPAVPGTGDPGYPLSGNALTVKEDVFAAGSTNVQDTDTASGGNFAANQPYGFMVGGRFTLMVTGKYGTISIDPQTGEYTYTLNNSLDVVQTLREGQSLTDESFQLWGSGSGSIAVTVTGSNDRPEVTLGDPQLELTQKDGQTITAQGVASVTDVDAGDTHTFWLDAACTSKEVWYSFTVGPNGITGYTPLTSASGADFSVRVDNAGNYVLTYLPGGRHLTMDDSTNVVFDIYVKDDSGVSNDVSLKAEVEVSIKGSNTAPIWGNALAAGITEDAFPGGDTSKQVSITGNFLADGHVTDDTGASASSGLSFSINGTMSLLKGSFGTLLITDARTGAYTYTLDNNLSAVQSLGAGETRTDSFKILVTDKHGGSSEQTITMTVTGSNDAPTLAALDNIHIDARADSTDKVASSDLEAKGHDVDVRDTLTYSFAAKSGSGNYRDYGEFVLDADGVYRFVLDNSKPAVRALTDNETKELHFTVTVKDQHGASASQDMTVHIKGVNDSPELYNTGLDNLVVTSGRQQGDFDDFIKDPDPVGGAALLFSAAQGGAFGTTTVGKYGTLTINADGSYVYELRLGLDPATAHDERFTLRAKDQGGMYTDVDLVFKNEAGPAPGGYAAEAVMVEQAVPDGFAISAELGAFVESGAFIEPVASSVLAASRGTFVHYDNQWDGESLFMQAKSLDALFSSAAAEGTGHMPVFSSGQAGQVEQAGQVGQAIPAEAFADLSATLTALPHAEAPATASPMPLTAVPYAEAFSTQAADDVLAAARMTLEHAQG